MPLYFKKLEKIIVQWHQLNNINNPKDNTSITSLNSFQKHAKKKLIIRVLKIFKNIEEHDITIVPDLDEKNNFYIKIEKKLSKL